MRLWSAHPDLNSVFGVLVHDHDSSGLGERRKIDGVTSLIPV